MTGLIQVCLACIGITVLTMTQFKPSNNKQPVSALLIWIKKGVKPCRMNCALGSDLMLIPGLNGD